MTLRGKGHFMWQLPYCDGGAPKAIVDRVVKARVSHVLIKVADGAHWPYNVDKKTQVDLIPPVLGALHEAGVQVWGWQYVRGDDPDGEAALAVKRSVELGIDGFVVDAEKEYKAAGKAAAARRYMRDLRQGLGDLPIALSSYRFPRTHFQFPFAAFLESCDIAMPQVYFEAAHNVEEQLQRMADQYMALKPARPIIPTGPTYSHAGWRPTAAEVTRFIRKAKDMGFTAANFWAYDFSTRKGNLDWWKAVADFDWPADPPEADAPDSLVGSLNTRDPAQVADQYQDNAALVTAQRTLVGRPAILEWFTTLFTQTLPNAKFYLTGKTSAEPSWQFTWIATSDKGKVTDGNDTLGLRQGKIQYHYTYFTVS